VQLGPEAPDVEIRYTTPSFARPEQVRFRHRLTGLHDEWIDAGDRRQASFYSVPPGRYVFEVVAAGPDQAWSTSGAMLNIVVLPPFWRTWWFLTLALLAVAAVALAAHGLRVRRLWRLHALHEAFSQQLIDSQESERRRLSSEMHDSLGQDLRIIGKLARTGRLRAADGDVSESVLDEIAAVAERVQGEMTEMAYGLRPHQLDTLGLSKTIESTIRRVAKATDVRFTTTVAPIDDLIPEDRRIHVFRIVQEAVSNVVEHSQATEATVTISKEGRQIRISVTDNGRGFNVDDQARLRPTDNGLGLVSIRERARILGGKVAIVSGAGSGTQVSVILMLERATDD
jgi:signal transduction histidine kinase